MAASRAPKEYHGFEQGPIRPPSESGSLLIRVSRNCPWNKCTFCPVYKNSSFSMRPVAHVIKDIDAVAHHMAALRDMADESGRIALEDTRRYLTKLSDRDHQALHAALNWMAAGMESVFLQDANALVIKPGDIVRILTHLNRRFPWTSRITSYARSHTVARMSREALNDISAAGLNRVHIGMESASNEVLDLVAKGVDKEAHVAAGRKVVEAGMELSEYVMPGLGGRSLSASHVRETADALNQINPHFIRFRSLAVPGSAPMHQELRAGRFEKLTDSEVAEEILLLLKNLEGITSEVRSDHILNLFEDVEGKLPEDKDKMMDVITRFLDMPAKDRMLYQVGRRLGVFRRLDETSDSAAAAEVERLIESYGLTPENVDEFIDKMIARYI